MTFNNYMAYSVISTNEKSKENSQSKINEILEKIAGLESSEDAKKYLHEELGIKTPNLNHPINEKCFINYEMYNESLSIEVIHDEAHSIYYYEQ